MSKRSGDSPDFGKLSRAVADSIFDTKCMSSIPKILRYCDYINTHIGLRARGALMLDGLEKKDGGQRTEGSPQDALRQRQKSEVRSQKTGDRRQKMFNV